MDINELFVWAEYIEEKYLGIQHDESNSSSTLIVTASKKKPGIATKTNPSLWSRCKSEAKSRMGGKHSARAMQLALKLYKQRGGGFRGPKPSAKTNKMKKWTKQKWMYLSDYKKKKDKNKSDDNFAFTNKYDLDTNLYPHNNLEDKYNDYESLSNKYNDLENKYQDLNDDFEDEPSNDTNEAKGRYLPLEKWESLTPAQREATDKKKKREGKDKQYVPNTEKAKVKSKAKYY